MALIVFMKRYALKPVDSEAAFYGVLLCVAAFALVYFIAHLYDKRKANRKANMYTKPFKRSVRRE